MVKIPLKKLVLVDINVLRTVLKYELFQRSSKNELNEYS